MKMAWRIGRLADIDISLHWTFGILIAWIAASSARGGIGHAISETGLVLALFGCVVLHELGHALAARAFGIPTHGITLLPIGGVAQLDRIPRDPRQEWIIALAGPAVNVLIVGILCPLIAFLDMGFSGIGSNMGNGLLVRLLWMNVSLVVFNLIPAFPMDGGRLLRSTLAKRGDYVHATQRAARIGQGVAVILFLAGWVWNPMLMLVAAFVAIAAEGELDQVRSEGTRPLPTPARQRAINSPIGAIGWTLPNGVLVVRALPKRP